MKNNIETAKTPKIIHIETTMTESDILAAFEITEAYIALIYKLKSINERFEKCHNKVAPAIDALTVIKEFIETDQNVKASGITKPLGTIRSALRDVTRGANPDFFKTAQKANKTKAADTTQRLALSSCAAACLEILYLNGYTIADGSAYVCRVLQQNGITKTANGNFIKPATIKEWRSQKIPSGKQQPQGLYGDILASMKAFLNGEVNREKAEEVVRGEIKNLLKSGIVLPSKSDDPP